MKVSRRTMLTGSAAAVTAPVLATVLARGEAGRPAIRLAAAQTVAHAAAQTGAQTAAQTAASVSFSIQNNTLSDTVYAFVTGQALDNNGALMLLEADGQTPYYPASPSAAGSPLAADCAIPLNASGGAPSRSPSRSWPGPGCGSPSARR